MKIKCKIEKKDKFDNFIKLLRDTLHFGSGFLLVFVALEFSFFWGNLNKLNEKLTNKILKLKNWKLKFSKNKSNL